MSINPGSKVACVLVGLPGTSKTLVAQKVCRYFQWLGINSKVFNVGNYRRKLVGAAQPHHFFDPSNQVGCRFRTEAGQTAFNDMLNWFATEDVEFGAGSMVGIYDATNATRAKRDSILKQCEQHKVEVMFIESALLENEAWHQTNATEIQRSCPDYAQMDPELALQDFKARVSHYEANYESMTTEQDRDLTFIKLVDAGSHIIINRIRGYLQSRIVYYLMNLRVAPKTIYFSRHGESLFNVMGLLGGDSDLSARGKQYARALPSLVATHIPNADRLTVWTSTKKRTIATAAHLPHKKVAWKALDELEAGKADGLTYEQVEERFPEDFANRDNDKYNYRYQDGESYRDVVARLESVIMDLERQDHVLVIGHQAILRCLYAYFMNYSFERLPYIKIPLHTLIQLTPGAYKCEEKRFKVDIEAVDTHRPKPKAAGLPNGVVDTQEQPPHHDDPLIDAPSTVLPPATATTTAANAFTQDHGKTLLSAAAEETPRIIFSNLTTNTFRDSLYPTADSLNQPKSAPVAVNNTNSTDSALPSPPSPPSSIPVPPLEEKAKLIAEALMQANAIESLASPAVALNLDEIVTPVPEQEIGGHKGGPLLVGTDSSNSNGASSGIVRSSSLESVATPPMTPVPSKDERATSTVAQVGESVAASASKDLASFQIPVNPQTIAAACV
ncbi:Fructose-2,6-bisphosphatase [Lobosporangium transversale]|nr:Fructose-2,6-bisphosphatase [Lobosporangium transversale]